MNSEIERYLYVEMTDDERDAFEEKMFADDELFIEVADAENRLVDEYVAGDLSATDASRFERGLDLLPAMRQKVANARSLIEFIGESRPAVAVTESQPSFLQKISNLFSIRSPAFGLATAALIVLFMVSTGVLLLRDRQRQSDVAKLTELQSELEGSRKREQELQSAVENERETSGDFVEELDRERQRREQIERELEQLRKRPVESPGTPVVASVFPLPIGGRGGQGGAMPTINIGPNTKRVAVRVDLPDEIAEDERLSVNLNQRRVASGLKPRVASGKKTLSLSVDAKSVKAGANQLDVLDSENRAVNTYSFGVVQR